MNRRFWYINFTYQSDNLSLEQQIKEIDMFKNNICLHKNKVFASVTI